MFEMNETKKTQRANPNRCKIYSVIVNHRQLHSIYYSYCKQFVLDNIVTGSRLCLYGKLFARKSKLNGKTKRKKLNFASRLLYTTKESHSIKGELTKKHKQ